MSRNRAERRGERDRGGIECERERENARKGGGQGREEEKDREEQRGPILANVRWGNGGHTRVRTIRLAAGADTSPCLKPPLRHVSIYIHCMYIYMYIYGAVRSVYGPTDGYSTRAHPPPLAEARLGSRSTSARSGSPIYASVPPHARVYARRYAW